MHDGMGITLKDNNSLQGFLCHAELPKTLGVCKEEVVLTPEAHALNAVAFLWIRKQKCY